MIMPHNELDIDAHHSKRTLGNGVLICSQGAAIFEVAIGLLLTIRQQCRDAVEKALIDITCGKDLPKEGTTEDETNGKTQYLVEYLLF